ncbi:hypothetical protein VTK56DRAFT_10294 [Thermocarpiscus australiensis]
MVMEAEPAAGSASLTRPCAKCRAQEATLDSRSQAACRDCYMKFIATKCIKQIGLLGREIPQPLSTSGGPPPSTRRYLLGLSLGVSSTVLLHLLNENIESQLAKGRSAPFELIVLHIDTSDASSPERTGQHQNGQQQPPPATAVLDAYRQRYPRFDFRCLPLSAALDPKEETGITNLPPSLSPPNTDKHHTPLSTFLSSLPTTTTAAASRTDILRQLTRRALLAQARAARCQALLLGHSTTALAELALAEAAKGRGFSLPWRVRDGPAAVMPVSSNNNNNPDEDGGGPPGEERGMAVAVVMVCHPLRDVLRKELVTYAGLTAPPLTGLLGHSHGQGEGEGRGRGKGQGVADSEATTAAVVSHRDLSIEEVMARYFAEVEENYPSVVANVARTAGKLVRRSGETEAEAGGKCGLCGMPLDELGDERWRGELGEKGGISGIGASWAGEGKLCYGCERSTGG